MNCSNTKINILIADDHALFREGIISMFSDTDDIQFTAEAANGEELIEKFLRFKPDIILADINMPSISGPEAVRRLIERGHQPKVLFLSMCTGDGEKYLCYKVGGMGLISKNIMKAELLTAINSVFSGRDYFGNDWNTESQNNLTAKFESHIRINNSSMGVFCLNEKERKILVLITEGFTSSQIAEKMFLGKRTIDSYRCNLLKKLDLHSHAELISYAVKNLMELSS